MKFVKIMVVMLLCFAIVVVASSMFFLKWVVSRAQDEMRLPQEMRTENVCTSFEQVAIYDDQVRSALSQPGNRVNLSSPRLAVEQLWLNASREMREGRRFNCSGLDESRLLDYLEGVVTDYGLPSRTKFDPSLVESARVRLRTREANSVPMAGGVENPSFFINLLYESR